MKYSADSSLKSAMITVLRFVLVPVVIFVLFFLVVLMVRPMALLGLLFAMIPVPSGIPLFNILLTISLRFISALQLCAADDDRYRRFTLW